MSNTIDSIVSSMLYLLRFYPCTDNFITNSYKKPKEIIVFGDFSNNSKIIGSLEYFFNLLQNTVSTENKYKPKSLNRIYRKTDNNQNLYTFFSMINDREMLNENKLKIPTFKLGGGAGEGKIPRNYIFLIDCPICSLTTDEQKSLNKRDKIKKTISNNCMMFQIKLLFEQLLIQEFSNNESSEFIFLINHHKHYEDLSKLPNSWTTILNSTLLSDDSVASKEKDISHHDYMEEKLKNHLNKMFSVSLIESNFKEKEEEDETNNSYNIHKMSKSYKKALESKEDVQKFLLNEYYSCLWLEEMINDEIEKPEKNQKKKNCTNFTKEFEEKMGINKNSYKIPFVYSQNSLLESTYFNSELKEIYHKLKTNSVKSIFFTHISSNDINFNFDNLIYHIENII